VSTTSTLPARAPQLSTPEAPYVVDTTAGSVLYLLMFSLLTLIAWTELAAPTVEYNFSFIWVFTFASFLRAAARSGRRSAIWCWCLAKAEFIVAIAFVAVDRLAGSRILAAYVPRLPNAALARLDPLGAGLWLVVSALLGWLLVGRYLAAFQEALLLREARESSFRARLAPQIIFAALSTLRSRLGQDPSEASALTDKVAGLFRKVLALADRPTIPLREELEFVESYLGVERTALGDRLKLKVNVPEELEPLEIPPLALQAMVEEAVRRGVRPSPGGGEIVIEAERKGSGSNRRLILRVLSPVALTPSDASAAASARREADPAIEALRGRLANPKNLDAGVITDGRFMVELTWSGVAA
jgi:Histidine kinase